MKPDAPDSVLRIGCRADGDTWRYVRSHLRGLLDELQLYDEALTAEDIRFDRVHHRIGRRLRIRLQSRTLDLPECLLDRVAVVRFRQSPHRAAEGHPHRTGSRLALSRLELQDAPKTLSRVELNGRVFWLNATLREPSDLRLEFAAE